MANDEKTFEALLSEAPVHQKANSVTLTGALARTAEEGKFALVQADGKAATFDNAAVKSHQVIGNSFGQSIVQVELDADKVPPETAAQASPLGLWPTILNLDSPRTLNLGDVYGTGHPDQPSLPYTETIKHPFADLPHGTGTADNAKPPTADAVTGIGDHHTVGGDTVNTGQHDAPKSVISDVPMPLSETVYPPFALATAHQVPAATLTQMEGMTQTVAAAQAVGTHPSVDYKRPMLDGTYPIHLGNGHVVWHLDN